MIHFQDHALLINESFKRVTGDYLVSEQDPGEVISVLNEAEAAVLTSGMEAEPLFNYGNVHALGLFACELPDLIQQSVVSVLPESGTAIDQALAEGSAILSGTIGNEDRRWAIDDGLVWQLKDSLGRAHGLGFYVKDWTRLS